MVSFHKKSAKVEETKVEKPETDVKLCDCGEPVAVDLGQTSVCKKHIRAH